MVRSLISTELDPSTYYRLDGANALTADFVMGNNKAIQMADGTADTDGATIGQLNSGLAGKSDTGHSHLEDDITNLDKYTQSETDSLLNAKADSVHDHDANYDPLGSASAVQSNLDGHEAATSIHYPQNEISITESQVSDLGNYVPSDQEGGVGIVLGNMIQVTQDEYDALSPVATTVYFIVG